MALSSDSLVNGKAISFVSGGVVEHVKVRSSRQVDRGRPGRVRCVIGFNFIDDNPFGVSGERVETELEHTLI